MRFKHNLGRLIFLTALFLCRQGYAAWLNSDEAETVAKNWANRQFTKTRFAAEIKNIQPETTGAITPLYIVNLSGGGFVIISGNDKATPVLGYSPVGEIVKDKTSPAFGEILSSYKEQIHLAAGSIGKDAAIEFQWAELRNPADAVKENSVVESIGPLLARGGLVNAWGQEAPYNKFAPYEAGLQTHAGCGAVSMGQLMWHWKHPARGIGERDGIDFSSAAYDWALMPRALSASSSLPEIDAVAQLLRHTGVSIGTRYHSGEQPSLAYQGYIAEALTKYFGYNAEYRDNFIGPKGLAQSAVVIKEELDSIPDDGIPPQYVNRLVQFNALKPAGHAFICDGYENRGAAVDAPHKFYFHFNFGWNGADDGYFLLSAIGPVHGGNVTFVPNYKINYRIYPVK